MRGGAFDFPKHPVRGGRGGAANVDFADEVGPFGGGGAADIYRGQAQL